MQRDPTPIPLHPDVQGRREQLEHLVGGLMAERRGERARGEPAVGEGDVEVVPALELRDHLGEGRVDELEPPFSPSGIAVDIHPRPHRDHARAVKSAEVTDRPPAVTDGPLAITDGLPAMTDRPPATPDSLGIHRGGPRKTVELLFDAEVAVYVEEHFWHHTEQFGIADDGRLLLTMHVRINPELESKIRKWTPNVEVINPPELRDTFKYHAAKEHARYH